MLTRRDTNKAVTGTPEHSPPALCLQRSYNPLKAPRADTKIMTGWNVRWGAQTLGLSSEVSHVNRGELKKCLRPKFIAHCSFGRSSYQVRDASKRFVHATGAD
jgi:hypothetical protein